jgi:hypothetical protein
MGYQKKGVVDEAVGMIIKTKGKGKRDWGGKFELGLSTLARVI